MSGVVMTLPLGAVLALSGTSVAATPFTITSGNSATATLYQTMTTVNVTATPASSPTPVLSEHGPLPHGVFFVDHHNGTASIQGTPLQTGTFRFRLQARWKTFFHVNNKHTYSQIFTLTVNLPA